MTIQYPTSTENATFFYTDTAIVVSRLDDVVRGSSPSVTYNIDFAATRDSLTPTTLFTTNRTTTSISGSNTTTFNNASIPANRWVWVETSAASAGVTEFNVTIRL
jgi:hypothetical protein